jgi:Protoglobin.
VDRTQQRGFVGPPVAELPVSEQEFELLKQSVLFTDGDIRYLRMAGEVLDDQVEKVLDVWYGFVGSHGHLVYYFSGANGAPNPDYLAARERSASIEVAGEWPTQPMELTPTRYAVWRRLSPRR